VTLSSNARATRPALRLVQPLPEPAPASHERSTPLLDDSEMLAAIARGDETAVGALHDRTRPQIDRTIVRLLGRDDVEHDDIAQTALIELVRSLPRFRGECSLDTWTVRITAHTIYKEIRRRRSERRYLDRGIDCSSDDVGPASEDLEQAITMRSALGRVRKHLDALDENKSWTVLLHDVCGYDLQEIAEITGATVAAAQTRLVRGRRDLHERIAADPALAGALEKLRGDR
jgi:RNA polymerase sigma-70 factor (ECF subfamily)